MQSRGLEHEVDPRLHRGRRNDVAIAFQRKWRIYLVLYLTVFGRIFYQPCFDVLRVCSML